MKKSKILMIIALIVLVVLILLIGYGYYRKLTFKGENPIVTMEVENFGIIKIELYPEMAPESVANFVNLVQNGFYDGMTFHRIGKDFMIQGGGYKEIEKEVKDEETGETKIEKTTELVSAKLSDLGIKAKDNREYCIKGEFAENGVTTNTLKHREGVISMARSDYTQSYSSTLTTESYNSGSSQFFIMTADNYGLDGLYAPFGKVIEGLDIVHKIENVELEKQEDESQSDGTGKPVENVVIKSVTVDTKGIKYNKPKALETWNYYDWLYKTYGASAFGQ